MGTWRRSWWTGVVLVLTAVNCRENGQDGGGAPGGAGERSSGAPSLAGNGSIDEQNGGAAGGNDEPGVTGDSGGAEAASGTGGGPDEGGEVFDDVVISDDVISDDVVIVTEDCTGESDEASVELTRYCLLLASCNPYGAQLSIGDCVWLQEDFVANAPCASKVTTCDELEVCQAATGSPPEIEPDETRACDGDVLHVTDGAGNTREEDCTERGLRCLDLFDPHGMEYRANCVPNGCDINLGEPWGNSCEGDDLIGTTYATTGGDDRPATVTIHCPQFGFSTCRDDRCVP